MLIQSEEALSLLGPGPSAAVIRCVLLRHDGRQCSSSRLSVLLSCAAIKDGRPTEYSRTENTLTPAIASNVIVMATLIVSRMGSRRSDMLVSVVKHLDGGRLVALARHQEPTELLPRLILGRRPLGRLEALCPPLCRDCRGEVCKLLRLKRQKLIASLGRLKGARGSLTGPDQRRHLGAIGIEIAHDRRLDAQGVLQALHRVLPSRLRVGDQ